MAPLKLSSKEIEQRVFEDRVTTTYRVLAALYDAVALDHRDTLISLAAYPTIGREDEGYLEELTDDMLVIQRVMFVLQKQSGIVC